MECEVFIYSWYEGTVRGIMSCRRSDAISFTLLIIVDVVEVFLFCSLNDFVVILGIEVSYLFPILVIGSWEPTSDQNSPLWVRSLKKFMFIAFMVSNYWNLEGTLLKYNAHYIFLIQINWPFLDPLQFGIVNKERNVCFTWLKRSIFIESMVEA